MNNSRNSKRRSFPRGVETPKSREARKELAGLIKEIMGLISENTGDSISEIDPCLTRRELDRKLDDIYCELKSMKIVLEHPESWL